jgi:hypothetical protein
MSLKIIVLNLYIDMYSMGVYKKVSFKNKLHFGKYKKDKFATVNGSTIVLK